jgi:predicted nucleotidyltransferase component of viral defense system
MNERQAIEYFHLSFSNRLVGGVDRKFFCLKGGCNLRFYFQSIRYSEDIDFDIHTTSVQTLKKNVDKIFGDRTFQTLLNHRGIEIAEWAAPKQTETTQRWKARLRLGSQTLTIPTKIEFSRRTNIFEGGEIKPITAAIISGYQLQPLLLQHYDLSSAIKQKINALIHRTETQARDIVDLKILKDQLMSQAKFVFSDEDKNIAIETLMSVLYDDYKSQVWPYLVADFQGQYDGQSKWNEIQEEVCNFLQDSLVND